jgi:hypothetical protein
MALYENVFITGEPQNMQTKVLPQTVPQCLSAAFKYSNTSQAGIRSSEINIVLATGIQN